LRQLLGDVAKATIATNSATATVVSGMRLIIGLLLFLIFANISTVCTSPGICRLHTGGGELINQTNDRADIPLHKIE
jgi:hypothetical protein